MDLWVVFALMLVGMLLSLGTGSTPSPQQIVLLQPMAPPASADSGCLPLIVFVGVILAAITLL